MTTSPLVKSPKPTAYTNSSAINITDTVKNRNPTIEDFNFRAGLPTAEELPDSDDQPVDKEWSRRFPPAKKFRSELQELVSGLLKAILHDIWRNRTNWLFGLDLGFYYDPDQPAIAPDGFLSLGVEDFDDEYLRPSYVLWDEKVIPLFALEVVSKTPGREHSKKLKIYQSIGVLYYLIYAPLRKRKAKFQLYKLINSEYVLQSDGKAPYWMPEIGLAIGAEKQIYRNRQREWLYWYDENHVRYPTPTERADVATAAQAAMEQENNALRKRLRDLGIDPDSIAEGASNY